MTAALLICLVLAMVVTGNLVARQVKGNSANLIVAGRGLVLPLAAGTLMAQAIDTNATVGNTDLASQFGFWAGAALPIGLALCLLLTGLFFAPKLNRMGLTTLPDFYRRRYGRPVELVASVIMIFSFGVLLAGNLVAGGFLAEQFLGIDYDLGVVLLVVICLSYVVAGGLMSDSYTDIVKVAVAGVGSALLFGWVLFEHGISTPDGLGPFDFGQLTSQEEGAYINWASLIALGVGDIVAIDFMQRVFAADSPKTARRACLLGAAGTVAIGVPFTLVALSSGPILEAAGATTEGPVLYALLDGVAPGLLAAIVLTGIVAAGLSTADGAILGTSAVIARNVLGLRGHGDGEQHRSGSDRLLTVCRIGMVPVALLGVLFALRVPETGILLLLAFDIGLAGLFVPLVLGLYWRGANAAGAMACIVAGSAVRLAFFVFSPTIFGVENTLLHWDIGLIGPGFDGLPTLISPLVGLTAFLLVSVATAGARELESDAALAPASAR